MYVIELVNAHWKWIVYWRQITENKALVKTNRLKWSDKLYLSLGLARVRISSEHALGRENFLHETTYSLVAILDTSALGFRPMQINMP